jgi:hypothetical protein
MLLSFDFKLDPNEWTADMVKRSSYEVVDI